MDPLTVALITGGSALLNAISGYSQRKQQRDNINRYKQTLEDAKYKLSDKLNILADLERGLNAEAADIANSALIDYAIGDVRNTSNVRSKLASRLLGEKVKLTTDVAMKIDQHNKNIEMQKAQAELGNVPNNFANIFTDLGMGAISGYQLAETLKMLGKYTGDTNNNGTDNNDNNKANGVKTETGGTDLTNTNTGKTDVTNGKFKEGMKLQVDLTEVNKLIEELKKLSMLQNSLFGTSSINGINFSQGIFPSIEQSELNQFDINLRLPTYQQQRRYNLNERK
jgi:hypothetical protein